MTKLYIVVEGEMIQEVVSDRPEQLRDLEVVVVDYDRAAVENGHVVRVRQRTGRNAPAAVRKLSVRKADITVLG